MKKKNTFLAGLLTLMFSASAVAQDLVIKTNHESGVEILKDGKFDKVTMNIGNCSENTQIYLGEVDFGEDGNKYAAAGIVFANGWYMDGWAVLHAGQDYESSLPFTQITVDDTGGYQAYYTFADSMAYTKGPNHDGVFEGAQTTFVKPVGKQKVYLTFIGGSGNIWAVNFYEKPIPAENFIQEGEHDYLFGLALRTPNLRPGYSEVSTKLLATNSVPMVPTGEEAGEESPFKDTKLDGDSWGWTNDGFIVDYGTMDFGNGDYDQIITYIRRDNDLRIGIYLEIYLDEISESNLLANVWAGLQMKTITPLATNIKSITGQHKIIAKWVGGGFNLQDIEFSKGNLWEESLKCGITLVDELPSADAFHCTFVGCLEGLANPWAYEVMAKGQYETAGNIGYTKNGTVINFFDANGDGVDFGNGEYKSIVVNHASEGSWLGDIDEANFAFYIDLDPDFTIPKETWDTDLASILEGHEPIALVRIQGTGAWSIKKHVAGPMLKEVTGKHQLYMVYNILTSNSMGANVFDIYLDKKELSGVSQTAVVEGVNVYAANGQIIVNATEPVKVATYTLSGAGMAETVASAGMNAYDAAPGFYIVKVTDKNGAVATYKVLVK
ncbi:T9SS type A sorting domain-containing protein [Coprobacter sp.]